MGTGFGDICCGFGNLVRGSVDLLVRCFSAFDASLTHLVRCAETMNIVGWSLYDIFLKQWLQHFTSGDLLVLYLDELTAEPLLTMRAIENHIGIAPYAYGMQARVAFNAGIYGWSPDG